MPSFRPSRRLRPSAAPRLQTWLWLGCGLLLLVLLYVLSPILTPFLLAGILAYILAPLVDALCRLRLPRLLAVTLVMLASSAALSLLILILIPMISEEIQRLVARLPQAMELWNTQALPWLQTHLGLNPRLKFDAPQLKQLISDNWESIRNLLNNLLPSLKIGGQAILGFITNLLLVPLVMFYLLLDWHPLRARLADYVPRPWHAATLRLAGNIDAVLAEFLRGQVSVMLALALYYSVGLWLAGVHYALPVGVYSGLLIVIPYLGFASGLVLALLTALLQFSGSEVIIGVAIVYALGQVLESVWLTPWLVGNRIGLSPLAVIFALLAFGQLFGFFGILLALPASAALLVGLRELRQLYFASHFYRGADTQGLAPCVARPPPPPHT